VSIEIRTCAPEEAVLFGQTISSAFGYELEPGEIERYNRAAEADPSRDLAAFDDGAMVGTTTAYSFRLTIPGGELPAAGVTAVGVLPSHRRRGILTAMMRRQLDDVHERGEPLAALWSSEGAIYGRFGYGLAAGNAVIDVAREWTRFRDPTPASSRVRLLTHEEAVVELPPIYDRVCAVTPGFHARSPQYWDAISLADLQHLRRGGGPMFRAVVELDGSGEAYALYRIHEGDAGTRLQVIEEVSTSGLATKEIWRFLFGVDLVARIRARALPVDHPLFLLVVEPRRLGFQLEDGLWVRLVDVGTALSARAYAGAERLVFELGDSFCAWNEGVWALEGGQAKPTDAAPDLRLDVSDLASAYLGGFSFAELARAGRVEERADGALARADELFRTPRAPWCPQTF
jgi:predicted acetyltransferase